MLTCTLRYDVSLVCIAIMFPGYLVKLKRKFVDLYFTLGCFMGSYSTSLRGVFHLCVMLECFPGT